LDQNVLFYPDHIHAPKNKGKTQSDAGYSGKYESQHMDQADQNSNNRKVKHTANVLDHNFVCCDLFFRFIGRKKFQGIFDFFQVDFAGYCRGPA
jgi:hypothetical protein